MHQAYGTKGVEPRLDKRQSGLAKGCCRAAWGFQGVAGAPRAGPCGALPRRVRLRTPARLTGEGPGCAPGPLDKLPQGSWIIVDSAQGSVVICACTMKPPISNFTEASEELALARDQLSRIQVFLETFQDVLGRLNAPTQGRASPGPTTAPGPEGRTIADRVIFLMREIGRPVWPRAVTAEYERRHWPVPRASSVYGAVNSAMNYLLHRRGLLHRNEHGYFLPDQILSESISGKKAEENTRA